MRGAERRVAVTGIGLVTPLGLGWSANWAALMGARSGIGAITRYDASTHDVRIAGEVRGFDPADWMPRKDAKKMDPFIHYALAAARMAGADAGLPETLPEALGDRTAVLVGSGLGGLHTLEEAFEVLRERGVGRLSPFTIPRLIGNLAAGHVSMAFGARGPSFSPVSACATGAHAVGEAARMVARGEVDLAFAGGTEATITPLGVGGFAAMKALSQRNDDPERASRPFDAQRDGFVCAEGAGVLVLEPLEAARARGARVWAEVVGYGQSSDAHHITAPDPDARGARAAIAGALADARLNAEQVGYVNAHGTSTPFNDAIETLALKAVFGSHAPALWVSSTKSMTGHLLGAAGAVEAAYTAMALAHACVPPTINLENPDPACDLDYVPGAPRERRFDAALSNSFGFGGTNVSLALARVDAVS